MHQYIDRSTGRVMTEPLFRDGWVRFLYSGVRENASWCFHLFTSSWSTSLLGLATFGAGLRGNRRRVEAFLRDMAVDRSECLDPVESFKTARDVFERRIRYQECRPMSETPGEVVSPADARVLVGSMNRLDTLFIKGKYFGWPELLGTDRQPWPEVFQGADFAVFRLTPERYHYTHAPVSGSVLDLYEINGRFHSCNPGAVVREVTPYSRNQRVVTVIDTEVPGGSGVGLVAMVEVAAMMIGRIDQCYSSRAYDSPEPVVPGLFLEKGQPKSLFRPGSSTVILLLEKNRTAFCRDIVDNMARYDVVSQFARGFGSPIVETDVRVRQTVALRLERARAVDGTEAPGSSPGTGFFTDEARPGIPDHFGPVSRAGRSTN
jgi:phosphatidylserine decarboxylase